VISASAVKERRREERRTAVSLFIMQRVVVISYQPCGTTIGPATSVRDYHYSLCNNPEERSSQIAVFYILSVFFRTL
jgi:hypothetical protein